MLNNTYDVKLYRFGVLVPSEECLIKDYHCSYYEQAVE